MNHALSIYIILQSLLFAIVLINQRKPENRPLALFFTQLCLYKLFYMLATGQLGPRFADSEIVDLLHGIIALCRPAILFYFLYSILNRPMPKALQWLWALPVANFAVQCILKTVDRELYNQNLNANWFVNFSFYVKILFSVLLVWQIKVFRKEINENTASKSHDQVIKLHWGKYFVYFSFTLQLISLINILFMITNNKLYSVDPTLPIQIEGVYNIIYQSFIVVFLLIFGYLFLRNASVFNTPSQGSHIEQQIVEIVLPEEEKEFQNKIELTEEQISKYTGILQQLMEQEKIYLDPELSLLKLSKQSTIPSRDLSRFIQFAYNKKYKEYINSYRTQHAQKMLTDQNAPKYTMYSIAYDSGFNSESTFYTVFKQQTGLTPKQYQEKNKNVDPGKQIG
jgi:AraC-like DNA-binding protein